ncbi:unnamed protein product [Calicophoron daubneyi]|uniref:Uncharacterized protein n=1 Tax=Calicophoron daubneyi TaxID=300641 RepID=A0AAV2TQ05_CALDB
MMNFESMNNPDSEYSSSIEPLNESKSITTSVSSLADNHVIPESQEMAAVISRAQEVISCLAQRCEELERLSESVPILRKEISSQIEQCMQMVLRSISERREFLLRDLDTLLSSREEKVTTMRNNFETRLQRLSSHLDLLKRLTQSPGSSSSSQNAQTTGSNPPMKNIAIQKHKQEIEKLVSLPLSMHPSENDTMSFFPTELDQLLSSIRCVGIIGLTSIDASKTTLARSPDEEFSPIRHCELYEDMQIDVLPRDCLGRPVFNVTAEEFTASLTSRVEYITEAKVQDRRDSENPFVNAPVRVSQDSLTGPYSNLQIVYRISTPGAYDLNVQLFGEHIQGSPFLVYARNAFRPDIQGWLETMKELSEMPRRFRSMHTSKRRCKSAPNRQLKADVPEALADTDKLQRGDLLFSVGTRGRGEGEFANPCGICVTREHKILVADINNASIQVFNESGQFLFRIGEYGYHPGQLMRPVDVAETINGNYLVSDYELHCVTVYNPSGSYMSRFGQRYLSGPKGLIADSRGRILVVDQKACMVCIFKPTGKFINRFGSRGTGDNQFINPTFVAVNSQDEIYVSDYTQHSIKVFDVNGLFLFKFGVHGMDVGMLHSPTGLAFDKHDNLFISDWGNNRVQIHGVAGTYLQTVNSQIEPLNGPQGVAYHSATGKLMVTDPGNFCFKIYQPRLNPQNAEEKSG